MRRHPRRGPPAAGDSIEVQTHLVMLAAFRVGSTPPSSDNVSLLEHVLYLERAWASIPCSVGVRVHRQTYGPMGDQQLAELAGAVREGPSIPGRGANQERASRSHRAPAALAASFCSTNGTSSQMRSATLDHCRRRYRPRGPATS